MSAKGAVGGSVAALALACTLIAGHEGVRYSTYRDINGKLTYCYGSTAGAVEGKTYTPAECQAALISDAKRHAHDVDRCLPPAATLPGETWAALVDFGYNIGGTRFCHSPIPAMVRSGDLAGACARISLYVVSGGKDCRIRANRCGGIVKRRADERAVCERGLA